MMPMPAEFKDMFKKNEREFSKQEHTMERMMHKMEKKGVKSFSDSKETVNNNGNLHEQETRCIDGKCNEKVMDGKTFDPQAEARKKAAIAAKNKEEEAAAAAERQVEQAEAKAAATKRAAH